MNKVKVKEIVADKSQTYLNLSNCEISDLKSLELEKFENLESLNLANNQISDISSLSKLTTLRKLILNSNQIKDLSPISNLTNLNSLYLENNQIQEIEYNTLKNLEKLRRLDLRNNQLQTFPNVLLNLNMQIFWDDKNNQGITLEGNPLNIKPKIIRDGKQAIGEHLNSQKITADEVKVLLVGDGSSGKTSLLNRILYNQYNPEEEQTQGINVASKEFEVNERKTTMHFWDFGGQEKFYSTHNFFFTKRSLYILLVDARKESNVEYWLDYIKTIADNSPVLIVMNKIDQNPDFDLNRRDLLKNHPNIRGFYKISCATQEGLEALYEKIKQTAIKDVAMSQITLPQGWWNIRQNLKKLRQEKDILTFEQFQEECEKDNIHDESLQTTLLNIYNDLGDITTYLHDNHQTILLNPNWIVEALYKIISSGEIKDGRLEYDDLKEILKNDPKSQFNYSPRKYDFIINTMKEFKRCFEIGTKNYILPDLLTPNSGEKVQALEKELNQEDTHSLQVEFKYKFMPKALITNFIVAHKDAIKENMIWKTGTVMQNADKTSVAIVESHPTKRTIKVQVWNDGKDDFFASMIENIKKLSQEYQNLNYKILIPLEVDDKEEMHYATFSALKGYLESNRLEYFNGELKKEFNILERLQGKKITNKEEISYITNYGNIINIGDNNSNIDINQSNKKSLI